MPTNSNAQLRYKILDQCFSDFKKRYEIEDLLETVNAKLFDLHGRNISERQIREDMKFMRDRVTYDAPIMAYPNRGRKCYYRYADPEFSIFKNELSVEELSNLRTTIEMLGKYRGGPANAWLEEVISNLEYRFGVKSNSEDVVSFSQNEQFKGFEFLSQIIDATINHKTLTICYKTYGGKQIDSEIHPYYVKQYNERWFLLGLDNKYQTITIMAFDRIQRIQQSSIAFQENSIYDFKNYFNDIIGVTLPGEEVKKEKIVLRFTKERFPYVVSKPLHNSQEIISETDFEVQIQVKPNRELFQSIYSFIPDVEVISPQWIRLKVKEAIEQNLNKYLYVLESQK